MRWIRGVAVAMAAALVLVAPACGDDDEVVFDEASAVEQVRDRLRDATEACEAEDRDRLRDMTRDRDRDRLRDAVFAYTDGDIEILDEDIDIDGERATVRTRLRAQNQEHDGLMWRFRFENGEWVLDGLPPCLTDGETPTTARDRDRDQDRSTTSQP